MSEPWYRWNISDKVSPGSKKYRTQITGLYGVRTLQFAAVVFVSLAVIEFTFNIWTRKGRASARTRRLLEWRLEHRRSLTVGFWLVCLSYFILADTHHDAVFLVKRLGRVTVALMPPVYFLTMRPSFLPSIFYLDLLLLHKWLSRVLVLLAFLHGLLYVYVYSMTGKLRKLLQLQNVAGVAALALFVAIAITSLPNVRRRQYTIFYSVHYASAWLVVVLTWYHSRPPCNEYMACCLALLLTQVALRLYKTVNMRFPVQYMSSSLLLISIPKTNLPKTLHSFLPGSHIRVSRSLHKPWTWFESSHPYTIASLPTDENFMLAIRKTRFPIKLRNVYSVCGPYKSLPNHLMQAADKGEIKRALFIIGGAGISYGAPVLRYLKSLGVQVKLIWAIRDPQDARILKPLLLHSCALDNELEIYFTSGPKDQTLLEAQMDSKAPFDQDDIDISINDDCCIDVPLEEGSSLLSNGNSSNKSMLVMTDIMHTYPSVLYNSRPVLSLRLKSWLCGLSTDNGRCCCVDQLSTVGPQDKYGAWVISAGNKHLVRYSQRWALTNGFSFLQEEFTL